MRSSSAVVQRSLQLWSSDVQAFQSLHRILCSALRSFLACQLLILVDIVFGSITLLQDWSAWLSFHIREESEALTCSQMAVLLPSLSLGSFCGLAWLHLITRPYSSD